jgi:hypothetical protein
MVEFLYASRIKTPTTAESVLLLQTDIINQQVISIVLYTMLKLAFVSTVQSLARNSISGIENQYTSAQLRESWANGGSLHWLGRFNANEDC